jgi:glycosyltransferase involved in cell wall biosynthesis
LPLRILMVTSGLPDPATSGAAIRISQFARHLARRHRLTLLSYGGSSEREGANNLRAAGIDVLLVPPPNRTRKRATQMISLVSSRSHLGGIFHSGALQSALESLLPPGAFDAVIVEGSLLLRHRFPSGTPLVLDEHNLEYEVLERTSKVESSPLRRFFNSVEAAKFKREEVAAWRRADLCLFTSEREVDLVRIVSPNTATLAVANGVDLEYFRPEPVKVEPGSIVFTGTMNYRPNADAVQHLVRDILPRVHQLRPDALLTVVGGGVPPSIQRLAGPRVVVTGRVRDIRPFVKRAAVMLAPLRIGGGTRLKVLEALAMGKAMVSTPLGCEGIAVKSGEHLAVADDPLNFAREVVRLLDDPAAANAMGARGRALAERHYGWPALAAEMERALEGVVSRRGRDTVLGAARISSQNGTPTSEAPDQSFRSLGSSH